MSSSAKLSKVISNIKTNYQRNKFESLCTYLLKVYNTDAMIYPSVPLGEMDKAGIDVFISLSDSKIAFQCKGFETNLSVTHNENTIQSWSKQIEKSIGQYLKRINDFGFSKFIIITNLIEDQNNIRIIDRLKNCVITSKNENISKYIENDHVEIIGLKKFIENYLQKQAEISLINGLTQIGIKSSESFFSFFKESKSYIPTFPYEKRLAFADMPIINQNAESLYNFVINNLSHTFDSNNNSLYKKNIQMYIISEFGFGKTSLLFELLNSINQKENKFNFFFLYIPIAAINVRNERNFIESIFDSMLSQFLLQEDSVDLDFKGIARDIYIATLKNMLGRDQCNIILLIDGLDENRYFYKKPNIKNFLTLLNSAHDLKTHCIFTLRKEHWDNYFKECVKEASGTSYNTKYNIYLQDWDNDTMCEFLCKRGMETSYLFHIIKTCKYNEIIGDIPKRPLFLNMLINTFNSFNSQNIIIDTFNLYTKYLHDKFMIDLYPSSKEILENVNSVRVINDQEDLAIGESVVYDLLILLFTISAGKMIDLDKLANQKELEFLSDSRLNTEICLDMDKIGLSNKLSFDTLIAHSPLVQVPQNIKAYKFAHTSFQDYFSAIFLFKLCKFYNGYDLNLIFEKLSNNGVARFLLELEKENNTAFVNNISSEILFNCIKVIV